MDREQAKKYIHQRATDYLHPDKSKNGYICPICGSGSGRNGTGITTKDNVHYTCWVGCFTNEDIIDIIGRKYQITDYNSKLQKACEVFNITLEDSYIRNSSYNGFSTEYQKQDKIERYTQKDEVETDYTDFFLQANKNIYKTNYHRGLSSSTLDRFKIGYIEEWTHPKAPNAPSSPRLIIPTSKHSYLARDTRNDLTEEQKKYCKSKVGKSKIFNSQVLRTANKPIFIVEGELDALSIIDVDGEAVALGSTSNKMTLIKMLKSQKPSQPLIIAMDNDEAGNKATKELTESLERLEIPFYRFDIVKQY